jgi:hypothetical protein
MFKSAKHFVAVVGFAVFLSSVSLFAQAHPSDDTFSSNDWNANFGKLQFLAVQSPSSTTYIKFDLSYLPSGVTGDEVRKATLRLFVSGVTHPGTFDLKRVGSDWSERKLDRDSAPLIGATEISHVHVSADSKGQYLILDVTSLVKDWVSKVAPNYGIALVPNQDISVAFDSKENNQTSHDPELNVVLADMGPRILQGTQGPMGPQGLKGDAGATGAQGPAGPAGVQGPQGATGPQGASGPKGDAGATGAQGPVGPSGPQGPAGPAGPQGLKGDVGATGAQGPAGPVGAQGPQGLKGDTGATGAEGPAGPIGPQGMKGDIGATGAQGPAGPAGPVGPVGAQGPQGLSGDTGATGAQGPAGPIGPQGPQGLKGDTGATGAQGSAGPAGPIGPQGPQGLKGDIGATGAQGPAGSAGADGVQGPAGLAGPQGATGATGAPGPKGDTGATGPQGPAGPVNYPGPASLSVSHQAVPGGLAIDLSAEGSRDWFAPGGSINGNYHSKMRGGEMMKSFDWVVANANLFTQSSAFFINSAASDDATGRALASFGTDQGLFVGSGAGFGFRLHAPADASGSRRLRIYVSGFAAGITLTAHLTDESASDVMDSVDTGGSTTTFVWTLNYEAARDGQQLDISVITTANHGSGNVKFIAATLQ